MGYIFISYSHKDKEYIRQLHGALEEEGFEVWVDERINYGEEWIRVVQKHVDECDAFLVVISRNAEESDWVQNELARAKRKKKPIFPLLLEGEPWLSFEAIQYEDVSGGLLPTRKFYERLAEKTTRQNKIPAPAHTPDLEEAQEYYQLGLRLAQKNRIDDAINAYKHVIEKDQNYIEAYCNLGVLLKQQKRIKEAEKAFRQAIKIDPQDAECHFYLGVLLSERKQTRANGQGERFAGGDYTPGTKAEHNRQLGMDEESCRQAIQANINDAAAWNKLGMLMEGQGRIREAEESYQRAIKGETTGIAAECNLGWLLSEQKRYAEAEQVFRLAITKEPAHADSYYGLGESLGGMKRSDEAETAYRKAFELNPEHAAACYNLGILLKGKKCNK